MNARPMLFSAPMIRALLSGTKTQTRRTKGLEFYSRPENEPDRWRCARVRDGVAFFYFDNCPTEHAERCPYGKPGDRLWVRETWQHSNHPDGPAEPGCTIFYRADYLDDPLGPDLERSADGIRRQWRPSIHMHRWASRITLEITGVRVERLQDISEEDAKAEGVQAVMHKKVHGWTPHILEYGLLWDQINGAGSWRENPWAWAIGFRHVEQAARAA